MKCHFLSLDQQGINLKNSQIPCCLQVLIQGFLNSQISCCLQFLIQGFLNSQISCGLQVLIQGFLNLHFKINVKPKGTAVVILNDPP